MRVFVITPSLGLGGAEKSLVKFIAAVAPYCDRVCIASLSEVNTEVVANLPTKVEVLPINGRSSSPITWYLLARIVNDIHPDVVLGWSTYANLLAIMLKRCSPN